jgi:hypothetical protein
VFSITLFANSIASGPCHHVNHLKQNEEDPETNLLYSTVSVRLCWKYIFLRNLYAKEFMPLCETVAIALSIGNTVQTKLVCKIGTCLIPSFFLLCTQLKQAKKEIVTACKAASTFLTGTSSSASSNAEDTGGSTSTGNSLFEGAWIRSIIGMTMKPSKSLVCVDSSDSDSSGSESESDGDRPNSDDNAERQAKGVKQERGTKKKNNGPHCHS